MGYFMGVTIVGITLNNYKVSYNQKYKALEALNAIHNYNILYNDIRQENILINEKGEIYIIDFGMSIVTNNRKLFYEEECELFSLLDRYIYGDVSDSNIIAVDIPLKWQTKQYVLIDFPSVSNVADKLPSYLYVNTEFVSPLILYFGRSYNDNLVSLLLVLIKLLEGSLFWS
ncbi:6586_t:CDS:2 [Funneliformis mosseae]|uniref:6586_t:CDS:1 n=1 Tax=Funneliformis mosseae TaxID=27381 RepID=A0A9N9H0M5_FUNMO|nr:6586_t:CDS:2 [Funneliformis mosseae]